MTTWTLLIIIWGSHAPGVTTIPGFHSEMACQWARTEIVSRIPSAESYCLKVAP